MVFKLWGFQKHTENLFKIKILDFTQRDSDSWVRCRPWNISTSFQVIQRQVVWGVHAKNPTLGKVKWSEVAQSDPTLCNPVDCSPPGFSIHGIPQARILEWVAISFSRGSSSPRDQTQVSRIAGLCFNLWATREAYFTEACKTKTVKLN